MLKENKGFTLIEVLIATAILVMVGVGVVAVEKQFMGSGTTSKHRLQATMLAQEGINMVRQIYDTNLINNTEPPLAIVGGATPQPAPQTYCLNNNQLQITGLTCNNGQITPPAGQPDTTTFTRTITFPAP